MTQQGRRHVLIGRPDPTAEAAEEYVRRLAGQDDVGLERGVAAADDLASQVGDVVHRAQRRRAEQVGPQRPGRAAVRPVQPCPVPRRAAEQLDDRYAERLGLDVEESALDARDGLGGDAAGRLPDAAEHVPEPHLERPRVLPDQRGREIVDRACDSGGRPAVAALAVAGDAIVGLDLDEGPGPEAGVDNERLDVGDLHRASGGFRATPHEWRWVHRHPSSPWRRGPIPSPPWIPACAGKTGMQGGRPSAGHE